MLNRTPERYSQVRIRNGSSWLKSLTVDPSRATSSPIPILKIVCSSRMGIASSQYQVTGSWQSGLTRMMTRTAIDSSICWNSIITYASGRLARGNCRALISGRLSVITVEVEITPAG